ncbi:hypothetical protein N7495_002790 [Penicillium taxi]|uniref:uncharacterized protein n=1 Tax=Penicillium taxi TaxID=168475 RepID=UPI00254510BD|nr:uncharacterized protein N7495_002790 [Penicillium taxi]KAJ5902262.1 hypothetical protein N7495_002790 [Penicillium taxi]
MDTSSTPKAHPGPIPSHGSSTGAPGIPGKLDTRSQYDPATTGYNSATGSGYTSSSAGGPHHQHEQRVYMENETAGGLGEPKSTKVSNDVGKGVKGAAAGLHGAGEAIRGTLTSAVDKAFGSDESAQWNEEIARRGEDEIRSGKFVGRSK